MIKHFALSDLNDRSTDCALFARYDTLYFFKAMRCSAFCRNILVNFGLPRLV